MRYNPEKDRRAEGNTMAEKTTTVQIVMPQHCNGYSNPRLFGGQIMAWIDVVGAVAARRYTGQAVFYIAFISISIIFNFFFTNKINRQSFFRASFVAFIFI